MQAIKEPVVTAEAAREHGLTGEEFERILQILGRVPTFTELGVFSVMWSEHCSYKNSIALLKTLPRSGGRLMVGAGEENAGLVDIGGGLAVAFKIESHNHPSAVEPYQGAATGVGGIMRDIFTMGARPIASLNSLRFGPLADPRTRYLFDGVVKGIGDYGNSFGVPTVGGEVYFDECYTGNPLVNAMAVGIVKHGQTASATASGTGNPVIIVGSSTGRDGIHGATFASEEISEKSESKRPSVQVGDPFTEKLLLEATLEIIREGLIVGIQDMGAAGISCSTTEMSAKGKVGMRINLDLVPVREKGMNAYEIMLSESQERMLVVGRKDTEARIKEIFAKWDLHCETIGEVTDDGILTVLHNGEVQASLPPFHLVLGGGAPVYHRETREPEYFSRLAAFDPRTLPPCKDIREAFLTVFSAPSVASKRWVYEQYDSMVRTGTVAGPGADSAVVYIKGTQKALAMNTDCNSRFVYLNPYEGAKAAVAEAARNIVCAGGEPLAITNCLNFGNPYKPDVYWQFSGAIRGMGDACRHFNTPVTGGNVSFYNESPDSAVYPTPVIGMIGLIDGLEKVTTSNFKAEGDIIYQLGVDRYELGGSEYLSTCWQTVAGPVPLLDLAAESKLHSSLLELISKGMIRSAHDISEGGFITALAECCITGKQQIGARVEIPAGPREDFAFFSETPSRVIISIAPADCSRAEAILTGFGQPFSRIGTTGGSVCSVNGTGFSLYELTGLYYGAIPRLMHDITLT